MAGREREERADERIDVGDEAGRGQRQREQRVPRRGAHRRQVAQVDGERLVANIGGRTEGPIEVDPLDQRIGGDDRQRAAVGLDHRGVVADRDGDPRRGLWYLGVNAIDEGALAEGRRR